MNTSLKTLEAAGFAAALAGLAVLGSQLGLHYVDWYVVGSAAIAGFVGKFLPDQMFGSEPK